MNNKTLTGKKINSPKCRVVCRDCGIVLAGPMSQEEAEDAMEGIISTPLHPHFGHDVSIECSQ